MTSGRDHYDVLGIARSASEGEVHRAYRRLARRYHPDVNGSDDARRRFEEVASAYEVLHDPQRRDRYDRSTAGVPTAGPQAPAFVVRRPGRDVPRFLDDTPESVAAGRRQPVVVWMW